MRTFAPTPKAGHANALCKPQQQALRLTGSGLAVTRNAWLARSEPKRRHCVSDAHSSVVPAHDFSKVSVYDLSQRGIQPKLKVNAPGDTYEREADAIADKVLQMSEREITANSSVQGHGARYARGLADSRSPASLIRAPSVPGIQHAPASPQTTPSQSDTAIPPTMAGGLPLSPGSRDFFEPRFGHSFEHVRIHTGRHAARMAEGINARAFTLGNHIVFGASQYRPDSPAGKRLLGHELTHVLQQSAHRFATASVPVTPLSAPNRVQRSSCDPLTQNCPEGMGCFAVGSGYECQATPRGAFSKLVEKILKPEGRTIEPDDEQELMDMVAETHDPQLLKEFEKIIVLWPSWGRKTKKARIIAIVTGALRKSDLEESTRGRYTEQEGSEIKSELDDDVKDRISAEEQRLVEEHIKKHGSPPSEADMTLLEKSAVSNEENSCLDFLKSNAAERLFRGEPDRLGKARSEYAAGVERRKKNIHRKTGSRLASELRLQGLAGPVNLLNWVGSDSNGKYSTPPVDLFDSLSDAGDGWYFYIVGLFSFHTFTVAVHVTGGGARRRYFKIQGGSSTAKSRSALTEYMNDGVSPHPHHKNVGTRVWQLYAEPIVDEQPNAMEEREQ